MNRSDFITVREDDGACEMCAHRSLFLSQNVPKHLNRLSDTL